MTISRRDATGSWIPLMEYSMKNGISLSTLRRHIKQNKLTYRVENGKYLLLEGQGEFNSQEIDKGNDSAIIQSAVHKLEKDLQKAREEIAELKTLIALYEETIPHQKLN